MSKDLFEDDFIEFYLDVKKRILESQYRALKNVNLELISLYWDIGKYLNDVQKKKSWGENIVENLSLKLIGDFKGIKGFSVSNLRRMKAFYLSYHNDEILAPLVREISWTKNIIIFEKCKTFEERKFYINQVITFGWTKNVLVLKIEADTYNSYLIGQNNFDKTLPLEFQKEVQLALKDEYLFNFLELEEQHSERELEKALIKNIEKFLEEFGGYFAFYGTQYRIEVDEQEYFIDILLYHRKLRCFVAVELKIGEFKPEYVGKMNFYLSAIDSLIKFDDENSSIGIILCKNKSRTIAEYALRDSTKPIGIGTYKLSKNLPKEFKGLLPEIEELRKALEEQ